MKLTDLTPDQREWFVANFGTMKNQELADHLGTSPQSVIRMARELGLWKTKEFVAAMQRNVSEHGAKANRLMGGNAGAVNLLKGNPIQAWHQPKGTHECRSLCRNAPSHW